MKKGSMVRITKNSIINPIGPGFLHINGEVHGIISNKPNNYIISTETLVGVKI